MPVLTRLKLYDLVWSQPLKHIAHHYNINPVRLACLCDAYDIPRPLPGHWQKLEHGQRIEQPAMDNARFGDEHVVWERPQADLPASQRRNEKNGNVSL